MPQETEAERNYRLYGPSGSWPEHYNVSSVSPDDQPVKLRDLSKKETVVVVLLNAVIVTAIVGIPVTLWRVLT